MQLLHTTLHGLLRDREYIDGLASYVFFVVTPPNPLSHATRAKGGFPASTRESLAESLLTPWTISHCLAGITAALPLPLVTGR